MKLMSETIGKLADALSKAQAEMKAAEKDSENPFFKSNYADLDAIWNACRGPLTKYGLAVSQLPIFSEKGFMLHTVLMHSSGEFIVSAIPIEPVKKDPQGVGACITYMKRFALAAVVGVSTCEADDDGETASGRGEVKQVQQKQAYAPKPQARPVTVTNQPAAKPMVPQPGPQVEEAPPWVR